MCSISYCRPSLPVKMLVTKKPFDSTLESATASFGRQFKQPIAGQPRIVVLANETCVTCVHCHEYLSYIKHECLQRAYNNYNGLTSASMTSMCQNSPMNVDHHSSTACVVKLKTSFPFVTAFQLLNICWRITKLFEQ